MEAQTHKYRPLWLYLLLGLVIFAILMVVWDVSWGRRTGAFEEQDVESGVVALLEEKLADGKGTFLWPTAQEISCKVVSKQEDALLVDITWTAEYETTVSRRVMRKTLLSDKYALVYGPIPSDERFDYPADVKLGGDEYCGSGLLWRYSYVLNPQTHAVIASAKRLKDTTFTLMIPVFLLVMGFMWWLWKHQGDEE